MARKQPKAKGPSHTKKQSSKPSATPETRENDAIAEHVSKKPSNPSFGAGIRDQELVKLPAPTVPYDEESLDSSDEDDSDGTGEHLNDEEWERLLLQFGEGEDFAFEGEDGFGIGHGEGEFDAFEGDDDDDDDAARSENDDLNELISLHAPSTRKTKTADKKKKSKPSKATASSEVDNDDDNEDEDDEIQASFEFFDPDQEKDWHSIKKFVSTLIDRKTFDTHNLADIIVGQAHVGTTIKCDDAGEEPLGFITLLSYAEHKQSPAMKHIKDYIVSNAGNEKNKKKMESLFNENVGILIHDRIINLPLEIVPVLYNELIKDIAHAQTQEQDKWTFKYIIMISKVCEVASGGNELWYTKFEEEFFHERAVVSRKIQSSQTVPWLDTGKLPVQNMVLVLPQSSIAEVRDHLATVIGIGGEEHFY